VVFFFFSFLFQGKVIYLDFYFSQFAFTFVPSEERVSCE